MTIVAQTSNKGSWVKIEIVNVEEGWIQILKDGKFVNHRYEKTETVIIELGKYFGTHAEAELFMETKAFKKLFKLIEKGGLI